MNMFKQIAAVTAINIKSLPQRLGSSAVVVIGIAGVVGVLVSVMAMTSGLTMSLLHAGHPDRALVLGTGARNEGASSLSPDAAVTIMSGPGIRKRDDRRVLASPELMVGVTLARRGDGGRAGVIVRGLPQEGLDLRAELELVEGRVFEPGLRELIVGRAARNEFEGLDVGDDVLLRDGPWRIVGAFETGGTVTESNLIADASTLQSAYQRAGFNSVRVLLESEDMLTTFADALTTNPSLTVDVISEPDYYAEQAENLAPLFFVMTNVVGGIMALGALFAAINTMYTAVSSRTAEIATLRAIGFGSSGVVCSVLSESLLLALIGALIGAAIGWALFNGSTVSLGGDGGSLVADMAITPVVVATGIVWACAVGFIGGLLPALRAARLPVAEAVRAA
jgi:putative ABC transport system permease protein